MALGAGAVELRLALLDVLVGKAPTSGRRRLGLGPGPGRRQGQDQPCDMPPKARGGSKRTPWNRLRRATGGPPPGGLRPDTNGEPFVPAEGLGLRPSAAC